jgi:DNA-binding CsgD family transcriptional regulator
MLPGDASANFNASHDGTESQTCKIVTTRGKLEGSLVSLPQSRRRDLREACADLLSPAALLPDEFAFRRRVACLNEMQLIVLAMLASGCLNKQIAYTCGLSEATIKRHVSHILRRLGASSRTQAAVKFALLLERCRLLGGCSRESPMAALRNDFRPNNLSLDRR